MENHLFAILLYLIQFTLPADWGFGTSNPKFDYSFLSFFSVISVGVNINDQNRKSLTTARRILLRERESHQIGNNFSNSKRCKNEHRMTTITITINSPTTEMDRLASILQNSFIHFVWLINLDNYKTTNAAVIENERENPLRMRTVWAMFSECDLNRNCSPVQKNTNTARRPVLRSKRRRNNDIIDNHNQTRQSHRSNQ